MGSSQEEPLFDGVTQEKIDQLLSLGYIGTEVEFCGTTYGLRTLTGDEELLAGLISKPYLESFGAPKAWAWANLGIALTHVNGDPDFCPPTSPNRKDFAQARFNFVTKWFWPLGEYLFEQFKALERERDEVIEVVKGKSQRSPLISTDWRDSSTGPDDSETPPEILGLV